jgi:hypothetical protein
MSNGVNQRQLLLRSIAKPLYLTNLAGKYDYRVFGQSFRGS